MRRRRSRTDSRVFHAETEPLKDFYKKLGNLKLVEGNQPIEYATRDIWQHWVNNMIPVKNERELVIMRKACENYRGSACFGRRNGKAGRNDQTDRQGGI